MMDDILSLERRAFLQQAASTIAIATVSGSAEAAVGNEKILVIYQESDAASVEFASAMRAKDMRCIALGDDPVRLWRDQLQKLVIGDGYGLMGRTPYPAYFVLRGLAAEHRRFPQHEQQPSPNSFEWLIQEQT
jgi:hypothetical protein